MTIPSKRASFNRTMNVYAQSSPGVAGDLLASAVPCRLVTATHIVDQSWGGSTAWLYVTTESEAPQAPAMPIAPGTFMQVADFTGASLVEIVGEEGHFYVVCHRQILFWTAYTYYRFTIAESADFVSPVDPGAECEVPLALALDTEYDFTLGYPDELWFSIPEGANAVQSEGTSRTSESVDERGQFVGGTCDEPTDLGGLDFIFGEPETVFIADGTFRLRVFDSGENAGDTFTGWIKFIHV